jgi:hypothetical protein
MSGPALIDVLDDEGKRVRMYPPPHESYHTMFVAVDELSNLIHYKDESLVAALTKLYDCTHFREAKRTGTLRHDIAKPHLSMLCGTTPVNLMTSLPPTIWKQGLMSRVILIHTTETMKGNRLNGFRERSDSDLLQDLTYMNQKLYGQITWSDEYNDLQYDWFMKGMLPQVTHPQLESYRDRRLSHLFKLSMIACIDSGGPLVMTGEHFHTALEWMIEAEMTMGGVFMSGAVSTDSQALDDIEDFVRRQGKPIPHHTLVRVVSGRVPFHAVTKVIEIMWMSGRLKRSEDNFYLVND